MQGWEEVQRSIQQIRQQQVEDFRLVMSALARNQQHTLSQIDLLQGYVSSFHTDVNVELTDIKRRLDRLENPAA